MLFFAIDNTLLDDRTADASAALAIYSKNPKLQSLYAESEFAGVWDDLRQKSYQAYEKGTLSLEQHRLESIKAVFKNDIDESEADNVLKEYLSAYEENWQLYPDVIPSLEKYKDVSKGIISNGEKKEQLNKLKKTGIDHYFEIILISDDIGISKPDAAIFLKAVDLAGKEPSQCYFLGDKVDTDAKAAQDAGLVGVWMNRRIVDPKTEKVPELISLFDLVYSP